MSTKPSSVPLWATAGIRTAANAAKIAAGFFGAERPLPQVLNSLLGRLGDWAQYLSDGSFTGGVTVDTLNVSNHVNGPLPVTGDVVLTSGNFDVGSGKYKHSGRLMAVGFQRNRVIDSTVSPTSTLGTPGISLAGGTTTYIELQSLQGNQRVNSVTVYPTTGSVGSGTACTLMNYDDTSGGYVPVTVTGGTGTGSATVAISSGVWTLTPTGVLDNQVRPLILKFGQTSGTTTLLKYDVIFSVA